MSHFLSRLAARARGDAPALSPRRPSRFESSAAPVAGGRFEAAGSRGVEAPADAWAAVVPGEALREAPRQRPGMRDRGPAETGRASLLEAGVAGASEAMPPGAPEPPGSLEPAARRDVALDSSNRPRELDRELDRELGGEPHGASGSGNLSRARRILPSAVPAEASKSRLSGPSRKPASRSPTLESLSGSSAAGASAGPPAVESRTSAPAEPKPGIHPALPAGGFLREGSGAEPRGASSGDPASVPGPGPRQRDPAPSVELPPRRSSRPSLSRRGEPQGLLSRSREPRETTVTVSIGSIEVRAIQPAMKAAPGAFAKTGGQSGTGGPKASLEEYLRRRREGAR